MCGGGSPDIENTESQKALAEVAAGKWTEYQEKFVPMQNEFIQDVQDMNSVKATDEAKNIAGVTNASNTTGVVGGTAKAMAASGVNPNSTQFKQGVNNATQSAGVTAAGNTSKVQVSQQDRYLQGLNAVNAMGSGQEADAISGMGDLAEMSHQDSINNYENKLQSSQSTNQVIGAGVGAATRAGMG